MIDKVSTIIMTFVILGIVFVSGLFVIIVYQEVVNDEKIEVSKVENIQEDIENDVKDDSNDKNIEEPENDVKNENNKEETVDKTVHVPEIIENPLNSLQNSNQSANNNNNNNNNNRKSENYSNIRVSKYFYNQLDNYSKTIYRAFVAKKEEMKTGTCRIDFGEAFSDLLSKENGQEELGKYYQSAIEAYIFDNVDVFYLNPNKMYLNIETTRTSSNTKYNVFIDNGKEASYLTDGFYSKAQVDSAITQIEQAKQEILKERTGNTYKDLKWIHDCLVQNINYDTTISKPHIYDIYGALVKRECVCEGYARAYKYLLDNINVDCIIASGKGTNSQGITESHAWNYVKLGNSWYAVDVTWDDPIIIGGGSQNAELRYRFFLNGSESFNKNHSLSGTFSEGGKVFTYPTISTKNYE